METKKTTKDVKQELKKVDFRAIAINNVAGEKEVVDVAKSLGNAIYGQGRTFEVVELARKIWKDGEVELTEEEVKILKEYIPIVMPAYIVKTALLNAIK